MGELCFKESFPTEEWKERQKTVFIVLIIQMQCGPFNCGGWVSPSRKPHNENRILRGGFAQIAIAQRSCMIKYVCQRYYWLRSSCVEWIGDENVHRFTQRSPSLRISNLLKTGRIIGSDFCCRFSVYWWKCVKSKSNPNTMIALAFTKTFMVNNPAFEMIDNRLSLTLLPHFSWQWL